VLESLTGIPLAPQQKRIFAFRRPQSQLIQSNHLPARLLDPLTRPLRNTQSSNTDLGNLEHANIICHGSNNNNSLPSGLLVVGQLPGNKGNRDRRTVGAGLEEPFEDGFVEF
jgi:hypothetical protein